VVLVLCAHACTWPEAAAVFPRGCCTCFARIYPNTYTHPRVQTIMNKCFSENSLEDDAMKCVVRCPYGLLPCRCLLFGARVWTRLPCAAGMRAQQGLELIPLAVHAHTGVVRAVHASCGRLIIRPTPTNWRYTPDGPLPSSLLALQNPKPQTPHTKP
jgi:hypothetical protein